MDKLPQQPGDASPNHDNIRLSRGALIGEGRSQALAALHKLEGRGVEDRVLSKLRSPDWWQQKTGDRSALDRLGFPLVLEAALSRSPKEALWLIVAEDTESLAERVRATGMLAWGRTPLLYLWELRHLTKCWLRYW